MTMSRRGQQQQHAQVVHQMKNKTTTWSTTAALHCVVVFTSLTGFLPASVDAVFNPLSSDYLDRILNKCRETGGVRFPNTVNATDFTQICRKKNMRFAIGENEGDLETTSNGPLAFSGTVTTASSLTKAFRKLDFGDDHDGATSARCWIRCGTGSATYQAFAAELPFAGGTEGAAQDGDVVTVTRKGYGINGEGGQVEITSWECGDMFNLEGQTSASASSTSSSSSSSSFLQPVARSAVGVDGKAGVAPFLSAKKQALKSGGKWIV